MTARFALIGYSARILQVAAVLSRQAARALWRKIRRRPAGGPVLLREAFEILSGAFIKFGQILSLQIETLPREYCDALLGLLDRVPQFSSREVERVFEEDLRASPRDLYREFEYRTLASASIGQVHRAVLKDGTQVAVKVQRPRIREVFERDNRLLKAFIRLVLFFRIRRLYFMRDPVRELSTWTRDELDYRREAANCALLARNAEQTPTERVPGVYWDLTTSRVLTMDYLDGPSVTEYLRIVEEKDEAKLASLRERGFVPEEFSANVIRNFLSDAFQFGVFHADLHPANLLILPGNVVGYVDFGIVALLTPEARRKQIEMTLAYSSGDVEAIYQGILNISMAGPDADLPGMRRRVEELAAQWYQEPAIGGRVRFRVTVTRAMMDLLSVFRNYGLLVDREMIKYIRATVLADGLVSRLAPDFDLARALRQAVETYLAGERRNRIFSSGGALWLMTDFALWLEAGPRSALHALSLIERRRLPMKIGLGERPDKSRALRVRAVGAAAVWLLAIVFLGAGGALPSWRGAPVQNALAIGFVALWTLWLLRLVRRLTSN